MRNAMMLLLVLLCAPCFGQDRLEQRHTSYERFGSRYSTTYPRIYSGGKYLGEVSQDRYAPDSISNPYGRYGSRYSPDSINNPYGPYGRYSAQPIWVYPRRTP